ncbi:MAG TPA: hypothetical protein VMO78_09090 [Rhizomicrobium sp.]|nr:hypothetical protein [Rhizomicrobium sp.]
MRALVLGLMLAAGVMPASARSWKPSPTQQALDYLTITHNKGADGRVVVGWMASPTITSPTMVPLLDKYVVVSILHTRSQPSGLATYDDVQGVQVTDGSGQALKEVTGDAIPPALVGITASANATLRQSTQGRGKMYWGIYEAGSVSPCLPGKLLVTYDGETYNYDTPLPGCVKN